MKLVCDTRVYSAKRRMVMNMAPMERFSISYAYEHPNLNRAPRPQDRVTAANHLPINASTGVVEEIDLQRSHAPDDLYFSVMYQEGQLFCINNPLGASYWLKLITIANNVHSENVILEQADRGVTLKIKKEIYPGEPLMMWFDIPLLLKMNIPLYLEPRCMMETDRTPTYRCHHCNRLFADPNPLKIHIALECNKYDKSYLWEKLAKGYVHFPLDNFRMNLLPAFQYQMLSLQHQTKVALHNLEVKSPRIRPSQKHLSSTSTLMLPRVEIPATATALTEASTSSSDEISPSTSINSFLELQKSPIVNDVAVNSAFKPYPKQRIVETITPNLQELIPRNKIMYDYPPPISPFFQTNLRAPVPTPNIPSEVQAAQMETIVSNLGKSKDGHHCLYCNRVYSRKYGLKIHIRTHTGYKPLKCKICSRPFGDPSNLNKHVRLHAEGGETPYKCDLCDKVLVRRRDLERHMKSRHPDNGYVSTPPPR